MSHEPPFALAPGPQKQSGRRKAEGPQRKDRGLAEHNERLLVKLGRTQRQIKQQREEHRDRERRLAELDAAFLDIRRPLPEGDRFVMALEFARRWQRAAARIDENPDLVRKPLVQIEAEPDSTKDAALQFVAQCRDGDLDEAAKMLVRSWEILPELHGELADWLQWRLAEEIRGAEPAQPATDAQIAQVPAPDEGEGAMPTRTPAAVSPESIKQLLHGWQPIVEALELSQIYPNMTHEERRRKLAYLNRRFNGPIKTGGKGSQPFVIRSDLIAWWNSLEKQAENAQARIRDKKATLQSHHRYGRTAQVAPDIGGSVRHRKSQT
jgi:hypothetical protein